MEDFSTRVPRPTAFFGCANGGTYERWDASQSCPDVPLSQPGELARALREGAGTGR